jgi:serine/threonine-protein phosphatase 5
VNLLLTHAQAISVGEAESTSSRCLKLISEGACRLDLSQKSEDMPLPLIPDEPNGRYRPTETFVEGMIESFKKGGKVPKRVAWEIILGVKEIVERETSLVEFTVPEGSTCDIIGDTHGVSGLRSRGSDVSDIVGHSQFCSHIR